MDGVILVIAEFDFEFEFVSEQWLVTSVPLKICVAEL
jgi:hypothetical protein